MQQHWEGYMKALGAQKIPQTTMPTVAPYETSSNEKGVTGFMDLNPAQPQIQANYDAMQGTWQGVSATDKALSKGLFKTEAMPVQQKHPYSK